MAAFQIFALPGYMWSVRTPWRVMLSTEMGFNPFQKNAIFLHRLKPVAIDKHPKNPKHRRKLKYLHYLTFDFLILP